MERIRRLLLEAVEVAFVVANHCKYFGRKKIVDLIGQIMPTAFVYGTSYWVYYDLKPELLCVCKRFGLPCKHSLNARHCLDMSPIEEENDYYFYKSNEVGAVLPVYARTEHKSDLVKGEVVATIYLILNHTYQEDGETRVLKALSTTLDFVFSISMEIESLGFNYLLLPHPHTHPHYGAFVKQLSETAIRNAPHLIVEHAKLPNLTIYLNGAQTKLGNNKGKNQNTENKENLENEYN